MIKVNEKDFKEAMEESENPSALQINNIYPDIEKLLTEKAKKVLTTNKVTKLASVEEDGTVNWVVRFWGTTSYNKGVGALRMAKILNRVVDEFEIKGFLQQPAQLDFAQYNLEAKKVATVVYLAISPEDAILVDYERDNREDAPFFEMDTLEELKDAENHGLDKIGE